MRRPVFFLLAILLLLAGPEPAGACSRAGPEPTDEERFAKATAIFIGHIFRVEEVGTTHVLAERAKERLNQKADLSYIEALAIREQIEKLPPIPLVEGSFRVVEVLKGQPPADGKVRSLPFVFCIGALNVGVDYLFFLDRDNFVFIADEGTRALLSWPDRDGEMERQQRSLQKLRELSKKEPR
jgi:hypothetical protein